jgi:molybdopterin/thiamine biosynthesis adenylyltransferase
MYLNLWRVERSFLQGQMLYQTPSKKQKPKAEIVAKALAVRRSQIFSAAKNDELIRTLRCKSNLT